MAIMLCPECRSDRIEKKEVGFLSHNWQQQRFHCMNCGLTFLGGNARFGKPSRRQERHKTT